MPNYSSRLAFSFGGLGGSLREDFIGWNTLNPVTEGRNDKPARVQPRAGESLDPTESSDRKVNLDEFSLSEV
ncbi:hypothetical protein NG796_02910 [Laspinema sp. A4]|uniref:hypothetical protein n=1 Tax=Laspinema sp. D2d TaxID=2953686 RepID=UPI0021BB0D34|nr:hypothetical protein [Laspinema sp. D2d]MCT7982238.1 hypothetical protein [Laspinema sp. D2d]